LSKDTSLVKFSRRSDQ